jgi:chitinase
MPLMETGRDGNRQRGLLNGTGTRRAWRVLARRVLVTAAAALPLAVLMAGGAASASTARAGASRSQAAAPGHRPVIAAYYYHSSGMPVPEIPVNRLTDVIYAFANINSAGECYMPDAPAAAADFAALGALKRSHPWLRTEISIGGWGAGGFSDAALTKQSRARFVDSCMKLFFGTYRGDFDGIDLDWEFPVYGGPPNLTSRPADRRDFTLLARALRRALNAESGRMHEHLLLTAALPAGRLQSAGPYDPAKSYQLAKVGHVLDWINLMTYDLEDGYSTISDFDSPMRPVPADPTPEIIKRWNTVSTAVDYYEMKGVPADKIVLGEPYFSLAMHVASAAHYGLYQKVTSFTGAPSWTQIETSLLKDPAWTYHWSPIAQVPWLFDASTKTFVTYDDPASLRIKSQFARARGLRGVFTWAIDQDDAQHSLVDAMSGPFLQAAGLGTER